MAKKHSISSDEKSNPVLKEEITSLRGGMLAQAEKIELPSRFEVESHKERPRMIIKDKETGKVTEVPIFAYGEVRKALHDLFK